MDEIERIIKNKFSETAEEIVDNLTRLFIHGCDMTPLHKDKNNRK